MAVLLPKYSCKCRVQDVYIRAINLSVNGVFKRYSTQNAQIGMSAIYDAIQNGRKVNELKLIQQLNKPMVHIG